MGRKGINGNQWKADPRQALFLKYYTDPKSETFANAYRSALKAGYSETYSSEICNQHQDWIEESMRDMVIIKKAEKVLDEMLELPTEKTTVQDDREVVVTDPGLVRIKQDTAKFVASRLNKSKWSERREVTGADGKDLIPVEEVKKHLGNV